MTNRFYLVAALAAALLAAWFAARQHDRAIDVQAQQLQSLVTTTSRN